MKLETLHKIFRDGVISERLQEIYGDKILDDIAIGDEDSIAETLISTHTFTKLQEDWKEYTGEEMDYDILWGYIFKVRDDDFSVSEIKDIKLIENAINTMTDTELTIFVNTVDEVFLRIPNLDSRTDTERYELKQKLVVALCEL